MRRRICILLAAVLLLLCLSGVSAGAENSGTNHYDKNGNLTTNSASYVVAFSWQVTGDTTISVESKRQWNPMNLCYEVTEITITDWISPLLQISVSNKSTTAYCLSSVTIVPETGLTVEGSIETYSRTEMSTQLEQVKSDGTKRPLRNATYSEDGPISAVVQTSPNNQIEVGPWPTALKREYAEEVSSVEYKAEISEGESTVKFNLNFTASETFKQYLCNPANWTGSTFNNSDNNTIPIATVTVTINMVTVPNPYQLYTLDDLNNLSN